MTEPIGAQEEEMIPRIAPPCILVIFGATGDLTARKLMPSIYNLAHENRLPAAFACVGFARREKSREQFQQEMESSVRQYGRFKPINEKIFKDFKEQIYYHQSEFDDDAGYESLRESLENLDEKLGTRGNRVYYLATQPSFFPGICEKLHKHGLIYPHDSEERFSRVIIEKPFGSDYTSAKALQKRLEGYMDENQIYRIDHYLGKETVQNLLVFRFANSIFESHWNSRYIDHVEITVAEDLGIGGRGKFWEEAGFLRDIVQNHMMQLLSLIAMEPPGDLTPGSIHDEKVKVIESIRRFSEEDLEKSVVMGQYTSGTVGGTSVKGYREEAQVDPTSTIETYIALRFFIDNWRWAGVPFYLRGGKRLPKRVTEVAITFKDAPNVLFQKTNRQSNPNVIAMRIQPDEGIDLRINCKVTGHGSEIHPVKLDFRYGSTPPDAYERLLKDCILGDSTLFARQDEVLASWKLITPILNHWSAKEIDPYFAGSWGPDSANDMVAADGKKWRDL